MLETVLNSRLRWEHYFEKPNVSLSDRFGFPCRSINVAIFYLHKTCGVGWSQSSDRIICGPCFCWFHQIQANGLSSQKFAVPFQLRFSLSSVSGVLMVLRFTGSLSFTKCPDSLRFSLPEIANNFVQTQNLSGSRRPSLLLKKYILRRPLIIRAWTGYPWFRSDRNSSSQSIHKTVLIRLLSAVWTMSPSKNQSSAIGQSPAWFPDPQFDNIAVSIPVFCSKFDDLPDFTLFQPHSTHSSKWFWKR